MKEINITSGDYLFIELSGYVGLPDNYMIISTTKDITEEQAKTIVGKANGMPEEGYFGFWDYNLKDWGYILKTAKESLQSLIQANGLSLEKNYLILRKL